MMNTSTDGLAGKADPAFPGMAIKKSCQLPSIGCNAVAAHTQRLYDQEYLLRGEGVQDTAHLHDHLDAERHGKGGASESAGEGEDYGPLTTLSVSGAGNARSLASRRRAPSP